MSDINQSQCVLCYTKERWSPRTPYCPTCCASNDPEFHRIASKARLCTTYTCPLYSMEGLDTDKCYKHSGIQERKAYDTFMAKKTEEAYHLTLIENNKKAFDKFVATCAQPHVVQAIQTAEIAAASAQTEKECQDAQLLAEKALLLAKTATRSTKKRRTEPDTTRYTDCTEFFNDGNEMLPLANRDSDGNYPIGTRFKKVDQGFIAIHPAYYTST